MSGEPNVFCVVVEGDSSDDDYTGVTKRVTPTGAEYRIVGPLADALRRHDDSLDSAFQRAYGEALNIRAEVPFEFLNAPAGEVDMETYEAVRAMADEITRLRVENEINRAHAVEHYEWLVKEREETARRRAEVERLRLDLEAAECLHDSAYRAGLGAGWNYAQADDEAGFSKARSSNEYIAELKRIRRARSAYEG